MKHQFFFFANKVDENTWSLDEDDSFQVKQVLRLKVADTVGFADGKGLTGLAEILSLNPKATLIRSLSTQKEIPPVHPLRVILPLAKHKSLDEILPSLCEIGVDHALVYLQPSTPKDVANDKAITRWQKIIREACKQCKRPFLLTLDVRQSLQSIREDEWQGMPPGRFVLVPEASVHLIAAMANDRDLMVWVGSERGLVEEEVRLAETHKFRPVRLGANILRAKTAVISAAAILAAKRDQDPA